MRFLIAVCALATLPALAGCASSGGSAAPADVQQTVRIATPNGNMMAQTVASDASNITTIAAPIARVWEVLPWVYDSLGIKVSIADAGSHTIGNQTLKLRRQLGNVPLSKYINCGNAQGPPSADTYEIQASIITRLQADASGGTTIVTTVQTSGRPVMLSGEYANCSSRGTLEAAIIALIKARA
jgi:uncharacterized lipoprotein YbaY